MPCGVCSLSSRQMIACTRENFGSVMSMQDSPSNAGAFLLSLVVIVMPMRLLTSRERSCASASATTLGVKPAIWHSVSK